MSGLTIPYDGLAEAEVIGCAVGTDTGYRIAAAIVGPADFYTPRYGRLFAACAQLGQVNDDVLYAALRVRLAARAAGIDEAEVRRLVDERSRFHDTHGEFAARVAEAARRRRAMAAAAEAYNAIAAGADADEALRPLVEGAWAA